jgi:hypothetical protein
LFEQTAQSRELVEVVVVLMLVSISVTQQEESRKSSEGKEAEREATLPASTVTSR